jgi:hypothetical protein
MTTDPEVDARLREAFASLSRNVTFTAACPAPERLWAGARGELTPAEVPTLVSHVADCGACAEAWRIARDFGTPAEFAAPARTFQWWLPAAAAILRASAVSLFYLTRPAEVTVAPTVATTAPAPPSFAIDVQKAPITVSSRYALTFRGGNDGQAFLQSFKTALAPYERGEYAAAVATLTPVADRYPDAAEPSFYLGVSHLLTGNAAAAVAPLERALGVADANQRGDINWYLAAAYERVDRRADAGRLLKALCETTGARSAAACAAATVAR